MRIADRAATRFLAGSSLALTCGFLAARLPLLTSRRFDSDEFEHAHVAWYVLQGHLPYRDFFEHHPPLFHYLLAGFLSFFQPEQSTDHAFAALFAARHLTWALSVVIVILTFVLARRLTDRLTAWVTLPIVAGNIVIALRATEIRPDGLATILWLGSLLAQYEALRRGHAGVGRIRPMFALAGLLIGLAVLASQKLLLAGLPIAALVTWYVISPRFGASPFRRLGDVTYQVAGVLIPWVLVAGLFAAAGGAIEFLRLTVLEGARWRAETTAATTLAFVAQYDPWFFALAAGGAVLVVRQLASGKDVIANAVLLIPAAAMFAALFVIPVPYPQYALTFIPLFAIIAARFVVGGLSAVATLPVEAKSFVPSMGTAVALAAFMGVALVTLASPPEVIAPFVYPAAIAAGVAAALASARAAGVGVGAVAIAAVLAIVPIQSMRWMAGVGDRGQFAELRYVLDHTPVDGVVLDGWTGYGVFRRHAGYHWMLHPGVRAMLTPDDVAMIVTPLSTGQSRPDAIVLDEDLRQVSPRLVDVIEAAYMPAGLGAIYVPR
jgi:hypothetical protein